MVEHSAGLVGLLLRSVVSETKWFDLRCVVVLKTVALLIVLVV